MPDFRKILEGIREETGWSDYRIANWINKRNKKRPLISQPMLFLIRTGKTDKDASRLERGYTIGRRILDLQKQVGKGIYKKDD